MGDLLGEDFAPVEMKNLPRQAICSPPASRSCGEVPSPINPPTGCAFYPRSPLARPLSHRSATFGANDRRVACHVLCGESCRP